MAQFFVPDETRIWSVVALEGDRYRVSATQDLGSEAQEQQSGRCAPAGLSIEPDRGGRASRSATLFLRQTDVRKTASGTESLSADSLGTTPTWVVLAGEGARFRINGVPLAVGVSVLRHRDELCLHGSAPVYFSTERLVSVETYRADDSPRCPRCTLPIEVGHSYVCCPACNVLHHQLPERECWTYTQTCTLCDQTSDLAAGYRWSPEGL